MPAKFPIASPSPLLPAELLVHQTGILVSVLRNTVSKPGDRELATWLPPPSPNLHRPDHKGVAIVRALRPYRHSRVSYRVSRQNPRNANASIPKIRKIAKNPTATHPSTIPATARPAPPSPRSRICLRAM